MLPINKLTLLAQPLQKSQCLSQAIPGRWLNLNELKKIQSVDKELIAQGQEKAMKIAESSRCNPMRFDSEIFRLPTLGRFSLLHDILVALKGLGRIGTYTMPPLSILAALVGGGAAHSSGELFWEWFLFFLVYSNLIMSLPCVIAFKGIPLFEKLLGPKIYGDIKPRYEFNRVTGRVKIYHAKTGELLHDFPFTECVAETWAQVGYQGIVVKNTLNLRHYQNAKACIKGGGFGDEYRLTDTYATWNFIQCYMDTSQPLPDIPAFEIWRSSDPATITRDRITQRNPRFWRDMTQEEAQALFDKQAAINLAQPEPISSH
ncbi:hypothetical protein [Motilimonas pumila]|nr:hypothetical protein [Motilimonas pumila]